ELTAEQKAQKIENRRRELMPIAEAPVTYDMIKMIASTAFVPAALRNNVPAIIAAIKTGQELGIGPMTAMRAIDVIDGNPTPSAELLNAMIRQAGHRIRVVEFTKTKVSAFFIRSDLHEGEDPFFLELTLDDFKDVTYRKDGKEVRLIDKPAWRHYSAQMLWARLVTTGARIEFPDVTLRLGYLADERSPAADVHAPVAGDTEFAPDGSIRRVAGTFPLEADDDISEAEIVEEEAVPFPQPDPEDQPTPGDSSTDSPSTEPSDSDSDPETSSGGEEETSDPLAGITEGSVDEAIANLAAAGLEPVVVTPFGNEAATEDQMWSELLTLISDATWASSATNTIA
ncbi:MAG: hypothetical protein NUV58_03650, partial [Candidatus Roizmanbacteria bacterium]|nr:hypothetical protein [Candidatus Roizmanbacteria bacterium]